MITIDLSSFYAALDAGTIPFAWYIFTHGFFLVFVWLYATFIIDMWVFYRQWNFRNSIEYVLLAIDVPKSNEQTPKAVESIFTAVAGTYSSHPFVEHYWQGHTLEPFSFEIVSIEGYIQFLVRVPVGYRDLVEAAVYAQYPNAAVTEVADYTEGFPSEYPNDEYNIWGTDIVLTRDQYYPIRTYKNFEHPLISNLDQMMIDPMSALLELYSRMGPGEQLWFQIVIEPASSDWWESGEKLVKKLIGAAVPHEESAIEKATHLAFRPFEEALLIFLQGLGIIPPAGESANEKDAPPSLMQYLSSGQKKVVEEIEEKISRLAFKSKLRMVYVAKNDVFNKNKAVKGFLGAIKQFNMTDLNGFNKDSKTVTATDYFPQYRVPLRQRRMMYAYRRRSMTMGSKPYYLNVDELASIYHFPMISVKAPLVKKVEAKRGEPPFALPVERAAPLPQPVEGEDENEEPEVPENLPVG